MSTTTALGKVCVTPKGNFSPASGYERLDIVTYDGNSYLAKQNVPANTAISNTNYWQLIASKGAQGEAAPSAEVSAAVTSWLATNITNPSNPPIDKSLSIENAAADAHSTGSISLSAKKDIGSFALGDCEDGKVLFTSQDAAAGELIWYDITAYTNYLGLISFYDSNGGRLGYVGKRTPSDAVNEYSGSTILPDGFSYAAASAYGSGTANYYKVRINWLSKDLPVSCTINNSKSLEQVNHLKDAFDSTTIKSGYALRYSDGAEIARSGFGITDYIPVFEGCKISKTWNLGSTTYGSVFYAADKKTMVAKIPESTYEGDIVAPEGAYYFRTNVSTSYLYMMHIYVIPPEFNTVNDIQNYEVTKTGQLIDGLYTYSAFPVIAQFNGQEVIAFRSAYEHYTRENSYGVTTLYVRNPDGTVELKRTIANDDEALAGQYSGELRVGGLGVTPDGTKLIMMGFSDLGGDNRQFDNVLILLDTDFEIVGVNVIEQNASSLLCGKVTFTPSGYMITTGYAKDQTSIVQYKSNEVYSNNFEQLTFTKTTICTGTLISEPDIGFTDNGLACIVRGHTENSPIVFATDAEGTSWGTPYALGSPLHSPRILEYTQGNYMVYGGARYISSSIRKPVIGVYDIANHRVVQESVIWDKHDCYGFYLDFVKLSDTIYDVVFYVDYLARSSNLSKIVYERINIREVCPAINRFM